MKAKNKNSKQCSEEAVPKIGRRNPRDINDLRFSRSVFNFEQYVDSVLKW